MEATVGFYTTAGPNSTNSSDASLPRGLWSELVMVITTERKTFRQHGKRELCSIQDRDPAGWMVSVETEGRSGSSSCSSGSFRTQQRDVGRLVHFTIMFELKKKKMSRKVS